MTRKKDRSTRKKKTIPVLAGLLAWLVPGAGHWYVGRRVRAVILFLSIHLMFWSGVAMGGVFAVDPRNEAWWCKAELCTGASGLLAYQRQQTVYERYLKEAARLEQVNRKPEAFDNPRIVQRLHSQARSLIAAEGLAVVPPIRDAVYVYGGVAGMMNLLCIFDAFMLSMLGRYGEDEPAQDAGDEGDGS